MPTIKDREALPFEAEAPPLTVRKRRTYVTLERAVKFGKAIGCKGCERIAEGVPHTDECHERFRKLLEADRIASAAKSAGVPIPPTPAPMTPGDAFAAPRTPAAVSKTEEKLESPDMIIASDHTSKGESSPQGDYWDFDQQQQAWKIVHIRPCKLLYVPLGNCPFNPTEVSSTRVTEWRCRGRTSIHKDNWQVTPHQRISSKSWVGST